MPYLSTKVDLCRGHDACPPRAFTEFSPNVIAEGFEVTRERDSLHAHGCPNHPPHTAVVRSGWPDIYANGERVAYVGAGVTCPSGVVNTGRPSIRLGEGDKIRFRG